MEHVYVANYMRRRAFLLGALGSGWVAAQQQVQSLGTLAYVQADGLWVRDLPDGRPRKVAAGMTMASPRFSPSGRWVLFSSEQILQVVSREGGPPSQIDGGRGQWWPDRDDLLVEQSTGLSVFTATNGWRAPAWSIPAGRLPAVFSPDVTEMAYADEAQIGGERTGRLLYVRATSGGSPQAVVTERGNAIFPCHWMPGDGELLYWLDPDFSGSAASSGLELFRVPVHTAAAKPRSLGVSTLVHMDFLSLAPSGGALAVAAGEDRDACDDKRIARIAWPGGEGAVSDGRANYRSQPGVVTQWNIDRILRCSSCTERLRRGRTDAAIARPPSDLDHSGGRRIWPQGTHPR